jgi:hypothetical protein
VTSAKYYQQAEAKRHAIPNDIVHRFDLDCAKTKIFLSEGLDRQVTDLPVGHIRTVLAHLKGLRAAILAMPHAAIAAIDSEISTL